MSSWAGINIPGLDIRNNLRYRDKIQHFQEMMGSHFQYLQTGTHTDMVFLCPQDKECVRVSDIS